MRSSSTRIKKLRLSKWRLNICGSSVSFRFLRALVFSKCSLWGLGFLRKLSVARHYTLADWYSPVNLHYCAVELYGVQIFSIIKHPQLLRTYIGQPTTIHLLALYFVSVCSLFLRRLHKHFRHSSMTVLNKLPFVFDYGNHFWIVGHNDAEHLDYLS